MFLYRSRFLRRGEVWFDNQPTKAPVDWILYRNRSEPVPSARWRYFYNRLIDLSRSPETLLAEMEPKTVAKIEASREQDRVNCRRCDLNDGTMFQQVEQLWNQSVESRRRWGPLNRPWLNEMIAANAFELHAAFDASGSPLIYIGIFRDRTRVQQLMSVSPPRDNPTPLVRAKINRASCLLLWNVMLQLKQEGIRYFDFGGWYPGSEDIQLLGANAFKRGFGGQVVREFECEQIVTLRGLFVLTVAKAMACARKVASRTRSRKQERPRSSPNAENLSVPTNPKDLRLSPIRVVEE